MPIAPRRSVPSCAYLLTIDEWYIRSTTTWGDTPQLFHGTFSELFPHARPHYEGAIAILRKRGMKARSPF